MKIEIKVDREDDGRWIAEVLSLPGVVAHGGTEMEARTNMLARALSVLAERISEPDRAQEGYRAAIQMITYEGRLIWSVFNSLLAANAFLVAIAGTVVRLYPQYDSLPGVLGWSGIALCIAWHLIALRNFDFYKYWFACGRSLEYHAFGTAVQMLRDGKGYAAGETVTSVEPSMRMNWASRLFRVQWLMHLTIVSVMIVYVFLIVA